MERRWTKLAEKRLFRMCGGPIERVGSSGFARTPCVKRCKPRSPLALLLAPVDDGFRSRERDNIVCRSQYLPRG